MLLGLFPDITAPPHLCARCRRSIVRLGIPPSTCLRQIVSLRGVTGRGGHTLHDTAERIEDSLRGEVLRGNEVDKMLLSVFLLLEGYCQLPRIRQSGVAKDAPFG
jgi:hypothetical protein